MKFNGVIQNWVFQMIKEKETYPTKEKVKMNSLIKMFIKMIKIRSKKQ